MGRASLGHPGDGPPVGRWEDGPMVDVARDRAVSDPTRRSDDLLDVLLAHGRRGDRVTHVEHLPERAGEQAEWPRWADADLVAGYRRLGVPLPWTHQVQAADAAWAQRHTIIATSTGSGKSMAFWLPALTSVRRDVGGAVLDPGRIESARRRGTVLYLSPTKALAADQLAALHRLLEA